jgi:hypothetical protein
MTMRLSNARTLGVLGLVAGLCGVPYLGHAQSRAVFVHERDIARRGGGVVPRWNGNALVGIEISDSKTPLVYAIDREGLREDLWIELPGAEAVHVQSAAGGFDGAIALVGGAVGADSRGGHFLMWISPDRQRKIVTQIEPYVGEVVTIAADGTIWTAGALRNDTYVRDAAKANVLKRYDKSGKELGSQSMRARARPGIAPDAVSLSYLMASGDRVGWFTNGCEYIEFSLDGRELERFDGPSGVDSKHISGVALDAENGLFLGKKGDGTFGVLGFDRSSRAWNAASVTGTDTPRWARILGFDGMTLITTEQSEAMRRYTRASGEAAP